MSNPPLATNRRETNQHDIPTSDHWKTPSSGMSQHTVPPYEGRKVPPPPGFTLQDCERGQGSFPQSEGNQGVEGRRESHRNRISTSEGSTGTSKTPDTLSYGYQSYVELDGGPVHHLPPTNNFFQLPSDYNTQSSTDLGYENIFPTQDGPIQNFPQEVHSYQGPLPAPANAPTGVQNNGHLQVEDMLPQSNGDNLAGSGLTSEEFLSETDDHEIDRIIRSVEYSFTQNEWDTSHGDDVKPDAGLGRAQRGNDDMRGGNAEGDNTFQQSDWELPEPREVFRRKMSHGNVPPVSSRKVGISGNWGGMRVRDVDYVFSPTDWDQAEVPAPLPNPVPTNRDHAPLSERNDILNRETDTLIQSLHAQMKEGDPATSNHSSAESPYPHGSSSARRKSKSKSQLKVKDLGDSSSLPIDEQLLLESLLSRINQDKRKPGKTSSVGNRETERTVNGAPEMDVSPYPADAAESVIGTVVEGEYQAKKTSTAPESTCDILTFPTTIPTVESFRKRGSTIGAGATLPDLDNLTKRDHSGTSKETPIAAPTPSKTAKLQEEKTLKKQRTIPAPQPGDLVLTPEEKLWLGIGENVVEDMEVDEDRSLGSERSSAKKKKNKAKKGKGHQNRKTKTLFSNALPYNLQQRDPALNTPGGGSGADNIDNICENGTSGITEDGRAKHHMEGPTMVESRSDVSEPGLAESQRLPDHEACNLHQTPSVDGSTPLGTATGVDIKPGRPSTGPSGPNREPSDLRRSSISHIEEVKSRTMRGGHESAEEAGNMAQDDSTSGKNNLSHTPIRETNERKKRVVNAKEQGRDHAKQEETHGKHHTDSVKGAMTHPPKLTNAQTGTTHAGRWPEHAAQRKDNVSQNKDSRKGPAEFETKETSPVEKHSPEVQAQPDQPNKTEESSSSPFKMRADSEKAKVESSGSKQTQRRQTHKESSRAERKLTSEKGKKLSGTKHTVKSCKEDKLVKDQMMDKKVQEGHHRTTSQEHESPNKPLLKGQLPSKQEQTGNSHQSKTEKRPTSTSNTPPMDTARLGKLRGKMTQKDNGNDRTVYREQKSPNQSLPKSPPVGTAPLGTSTGRKAHKDKDRTLNKGQASPNQPLPKSNESHLPPREDKTGNLHRTRSNSGRRSASSSEAPPVNSARPGASPGDPKREENEEEECNRQGSFAQQECDEENDTRQGGRQTADHERGRQGSSTQDDSQEREKKVRSGMQEDSVDRDQSRTKNGIMKTRTIPAAVYGFLLASFHLLCSWGLRYKVADRSKEFLLWLAVFVQIIILCIIAFICSTIGYYLNILWEVLCDIGRGIKRALHFVGSKLYCLTYLWSYFLRPALAVAVLLLYLVFHTVAWLWRSCRGLWLKYKEPRASRMGEPRWEEFFRSGDGFPSGGGHSGTCNGNGRNNAGFTSGAQNGGTSSHTSSGHADSSAGSGHATSNGFTPRSDGIHSAGSSEPSRPSGRDTSQESRQAISRILAAEDAYDVLKVDKYCSQEEIKRAYRKLAVLVHPDKSEHSDSQRAFQKLQGAQDQIGDQESRRKYDEEIRQQEYTNNLMRQGLVLLCGQCQGSHQKVRTNRMARTARFCNYHNSYHPAYDDDIWVETILIGLSRAAYMCEDNIIYEITEWAKCNAIINHPANTCEVFIRRSCGPAEQRRSQHFQNMNDLFRHFASSSGQSSRGKGQPRTKGKRRKNNRR